MSFCFQKDRVFGHYAVHDSRVLEVDLLRARAVVFPGGHSVLITGTDRNDWPYEAVLDEAAVVIAHQESSWRLATDWSADNYKERKMPEEVHEMQESAERAHEDPSLVPVTVTMATLAVLVAAVALLGHRAHTEELLNQTRATDTWAEYQAKSVAGVTMGVNSCSIRQPNFLALTAKRRRWSSLKRSRLPPSCSRRTRFSS